MVNAIEFQSLPQPRRRTNAPAMRFTAAAEMLKARPGQWARVQKREKRARAATAAYQINRGLLAAFRPAGSFEAASRTVDGEYLVYARYVGHVQESKTTGERRQIHDAH
ncbi:hypothetical protein ACH4FX_33055 [Streptomyces sp. NPDC018019]|uniref:hypothetical protein n=1 Tax=Streptomyces sp. NPDC018019 TaxID=3365030 RepID=UPI0037A43894